MFFRKKDDLNAETRELVNAITKGFSESGYIAPEVLPRILDKIKEAVVSESGFSHVFSHDDCLTLQEKKDLKLPTRKKISREMIDSLSAKGRELKDPKGDLEHLYYGPYAILEKRKTRERFSGSDPYFYGYQIVAPLTFDTCVKCGAYDGTFLRTVEEYDAFERLECLNDYCDGCMLVPVMKGTEDIHENGPTYAGWFEKLSETEKKKILGDYYDRYAASGSLKGILDSGPPGP